MNRKVPSFAVVGRINKGKSSIVSTLAEDESVRVDRVPGTTKRCQRLDVRVGGRVLLSIVDTPGFEDGGLGYLIVDDPENAITLRESMERYQPQRVNPPGAQTAYSN